MSQAYTTTHTVRLTAAELDEARCDLESVRRQYRKTEAEKKETAREFKAELDKLSAEEATLLEELQTEMGMRTLRVVDRVNRRTMTVQTVEVGTDRVVATRPANQKDLQQPLPLDAVEVIEAEVEDAELVEASE